MLKNPYMETQAAKKFSYTTRDHTTEHTMDSVMKKSSLFSQECLTSSIWGGLAPKVRFIILDETLRVIENKLEQTPKAERTPFFQGVTQQQLQTLRQQISESIKNPLIRRDQDIQDHEKLAGNHIDYGQWLIAQTTPLTRILFGHAGYDVTQSPARSSWYQTITNKLSLFSGYSQFQILRRYTRKLQTEYQDDYDIFKGLQHSGSRPLKYYWSEVFSDITTATLVVLSFFLVLVSHTPPYQSLKPLFIGFYHLIPYLLVAGGTLLFLKDNDLGTPETSKSTLRLMYDILKLSFFEGLSFLAPIYSAISLLLGTPYLLLKKAIFSDKNQPWTLDNITNEFEGYCSWKQHLSYQFFYSSWLDLSLTLLELVTSSYIIFWGLNVIPYLTALMAAPFALSLAVETVRKGKNLAYYKFRNHYLTASQCLSSMVTPIKAQPESRKGLLEKHPTLRLVTN